MSDLYITIVSELKRHADKEGYKIAKRYHKYEGYKSYGLVASLFRNLVKQYKEDIQALSCKDALTLAQRFYSSHIE